MRRAQDVGEHRGAAADREGLQPDRHAGWSTPHLQRPDE
jgi:hypothetical protein